MYSVPFGKGQLRFDLPPDMKGTLVESRPSEPLSHVKKDVEEALNHPFNTKPLVELARPGDNVCIIFTDMTRNSPDHILVPAVLSQLESAGVLDKDITLLCGIGMHRTSTEEEKVIKLGKAVVDRYRVIDSEPQKPASLVQLGTTDSGMPLSVHKSAYEADLLIDAAAVRYFQEVGMEAITAKDSGAVVVCQRDGVVDHVDARLAQRALRLGRLGGVVLGQHVVADPVVQVRLALRPRHERPDLVARDRHQVVGDARRREQIRRLT